MPKDDSRNLVLELPPDPAFLPTATAAAENAAQAFGLESAGALKLSLAVEEFFAYLCRFAGREEPLRLTLSPGGGFVRAAFRFRAGDVSLRALNFAASVSLDDAAGGEEGDELGLLVASRTTDRCSLASSGAGVYVVAAEVDRDVPEGKPITAKQHLTRPLRLASPNDAASSGRLQHAALLAAGRYPASLCHASFFRPALFAERVAGGGLNVLLALDAADRPAGLLCHHPSGDSAVSFSGPYVFADADDAELCADIATLLAEGFLSRVARSQAICAFSERPTGDVPPGWFERLGSLILHDGPEGRPEERTALFRHLHEDAGGTVWAHADLQPFLEREFARLAFPRDIIPAAPTPEASLPRSSLFATSLDRRRGMALLRPLLDGRDFAANLTTQVNALSKVDLPRGGAPDVLLHLDLSEPWQAARFPDLTACGFTPRFILPHAGASDILACQHVPAAR